ncbi:MarR family transcriptional regulator [Actibacterium pelagium]|uniref:Uncharacterized protein n=1 Tax=Actibacterium pelagium TaxID=2029103 RepID=A0A917ALQ3_9RHOB|nr:helix-turn-helix domain-containing protein [Actibacterium pelagium]GGE60975.1 hypothetical protein GCM10011517_30650 [Actibacterium pelagium]
MISIVELAAELGIRKQSVFKIVKRLGIEAQKLKTDDSRGQLAAHVSDEEADLIRQSVKPQVSPMKADEKTNSAGWFYLIQLEPEVDPGRYKVGFAQDLDQRVRSHRTSAPFSIVVNAWPCKFLWEKTAIDCVSRDSEKLHTEVFRTSDLGEVESLAEQFFSAMPNPNDLS